MCSSQPKLFFPNGDLDLEAVKGYQGNPLPLLPFIEDQNTFRLLVDRIPSQDRLDVILYLLISERIDLITQMINENSSSGLGVDLSFHQKDKIIKRVFEITTITYSQFKTIYTALKIDKISIDMLIGSINRGNYSAVKFFLQEANLDHLKIEKHQFLFLTINHHCYELQSISKDRERHLLDLYRLLLTHPQIKSQVNENLLFRASMAKSIPLSLFKLLLDHSDTSKINKEVLFNGAVNSGNCEILKYLIRGFGSVPVGEIPSAASSGELEIIKTLIKEEADPSERDNLGIAWGASEGHYEIVHFLLSDPRVDPSGRNNLALKLALDEGHDEIVELLLSDPRVREIKSSRTPLRELNRRIKKATLEQDHGRVVWLKDCIDRYDLKRSP